GGGAGGGRRPRGGGGHVSPGIFNPPVREATFSWTCSSTLRAASLTAAITRSWSISTSSLLTTSGSSFRLLSCFWPSISTLTMPPPAAASTTRAAISCCIFSCCCWICFRSFWGLPKGFTGVSLFGPALAARLRLADVHDLAVEEVEGLLDRGLALGLAHQPLAFELDGGRRGLGFGRGPGLDPELQRPARRLHGQIP